MNATLETIPGRDERLVLRGSSLGLKASPESLIGTTIDSFGAIPSGLSERMAKINALAKKPLAEGAVYIHVAEALSNVFLPDRWAFIGSDTIKRAAMNAENPETGIAFLNNHRWDLLPLGRVFAGEYQQALGAGGKIVERTLMAIYMPVAFKPNGDSEPGTDDLHQGIDAGVVFDVSVGMLPGGTGKTICNVCGASYWSSACGHYRGSNYNMTLDEQIYARDVLGVPDGLCSVTYQDWSTDELSAVWNGAAAGAGFKS